MKLINKFLKGKKFSNTPTGRAMQRLYDLEHGITMQKALPEVEVFPNLYDIDNNGYGNSFALPLEQRPTTFSQGETSQPYVPKKLDELGWLNRTFGINNFDLGIRELIGNPANVIPTGKTIQGIKALTSAGNKVKNVGQTVSKVKRAYNKPNADIIPVEGNITTSNVPVITAENASNITSEQWTAAQDAAIARGDMVEAQRLRDLHFMVNTPDNVVTTNWSYYPELRGKPQKLYHGTWDDWNIFDPNMFGETDPGFFGKGIYTTRKKAYAETYGDRVKELYGYAKNPLENKKGSITNKAVPYFGRNLDMTNATPEIKNMVSNSDGVNVYGRYSLTSPESPFEEMVFPLHGKTIKSANAVTFDDKGTRIPLGKRDNFNSPDIRWGLFPLTIEGSYVEYNKHKTDNNL